MAETPREKALRILEHPSPDMLDETTAVEALERAGLVIVDAKALRVFLDNCGQASKCVGCGAAIWWFTARNNRRWPVNAQGGSHFGDCPKAGDFKRPK